MSTPAGVIPQAAPAAIPSVPVPAAPAASSLPAPDLTSKIQAASNPLALRNIMKDITKRGSAPAPAAPAPVETPAPAAPAAPEASSPETAPAAEAPASPAESSETPTAETPAEATPESSQEPSDGDDPLEVPDAGKLRIRLPAEDKVGRLATQFARRNPDWSLEQAIEAAKKQLGVNPQTAPTAETPAVPGEPKLPTTVQSVDQAVDTLEQEKTKAATELRMEDVAKIDIQLRRLERQRLTLERQSEQQQQTNLVKYNSDFDAAQRQASEMYQDAAKPDTAFGKRMAEIDTMLEETGDPLFNSPQKPLRVAQMVAAEMNIAPRKKATVPAQPAPAPKPAVAAPKKQMIPAGGSSTAPSSPQPAVSPDITGVKTLGDLRALNKKLGIKQF